MATEVINLKTVFTGFDNGTNLDPIGVRQNNQGVTLAEANAFIEVDAAVPDGTKGLVGDFSFSSTGTGANDSKLFVCVSPFGTIEVTRTVAAQTDPSAAGSFPLTVTGIAPTGGSGTGLVVTLVFLNSTTLTSATATTAGVGYKTTDILTVAAGLTGAGSGAFNLSPDANSVIARYRSVVLGA